MILVQGRAERRGIGSRGRTGLVLVEVGVVQVIVMKVLLLAPDSPGGISQSSKEQGAANTTNYATDRLLGCLAEAGAALFAVAVGQ